MDRVDAATEYGACALVAQAPTAELTASAKRRASWPPFAGRVSTMHMGLTIAHQPEPSHTC